MSKLNKLVAATAIVSTVGVGLAQIADADTYTVKKEILFGISQLTTVQLLINLCKITI